MLVKQQPHLAPAALTLLAGLAAAEAVQAAAPLPLRIKWPNDVMVAEKKLAGVMIESRDGMYHALGIGINCHQASEDFPVELRDRACSIHSLTGTAIDRNRLAATLIGSLNDWIMRVLAGDTKSLHGRWLGYCDMTGQNLTVAHDGRTFTGRVVDVDAQRGLLLQIPNGPVKVFDPSTTTVVH